MGQKCVRRCRCHSNRISMGMHGIKLTTATIQRSYHPSDLMNESSEISPLRMSSVAAESSLGRSAQPAGPEARGHKAL